ncbi:unnamed protein product, partial [Owenia fusiformis]
TQYSSILQTSQLTSPSDAPTNVILIPQRRSLTVIFDTLRRPNGRITTYESNIYNLDAGTDTIQNHTTARKLSITVETIIIRDLEPYTNYTIRVRAYTSVGSGPWSGPVSECTLEAAPENVSSFNAAPINYTTVHLTWTPPTKRNGIIREYVIKNPPAANVRVPSTTQEYIVTGLNGYTHYTFGIVAVTVEVGNEARISVQTPEGPPTIVRNLEAPKDGITACSITLIWKEPEIPHGIIRHYIIRHISTQTTKNEEKIELTTTTNLTLENLHHDSTYDIKVAAVTVSEGQGSSVTVTTLSKPPLSPVSNVGAIVGGTVVGLLFFLILVSITVVLLKRNK